MVFAAVVSVEVHAALLGLVLLTVARDVEPAISQPEARIRIETLRVDESEVLAADPGRVLANAAGVEGQGIAQMGIPTSRPPASLPASSPLAPASDIAARIAAEVAATEPLASGSVEGQRADAVAPAQEALPGEHLPESALEGEASQDVHLGQALLSASAMAERAQVAPIAAPALHPATGPLREAPVRGAELSDAALPPAIAAGGSVAETTDIAMAVPAVAAPSEQLGPMTPGSGVAATVAEVRLGTALRSEPTMVAAHAVRFEVAGIVSRRVDTANPQVPAAASVAVQAPKPLPVPPGSPRASIVSPATPQSAAIAPSGERAIATLAWTGERHAEVDPVSLSAIMSFMQEGDLRGSGDEVRDALSKLLASVPCARLQSTFVPETGRLELHGHIPEEGLRQPILAALRDQVGQAISVADHMLVLPRPQCATLVRVAATTLPQSTDQSPNPRVVGSEAYARIYDFTEGQRLVFELLGPDYENYVYADYFDVQGDVIHLQPNEVVPLRPVGAAEAVRIGDDLGLAVGPPFGQEIVVVMATSRPLYEGLRPAPREPAMPYLEFLAERVREARARDPAFKGEWVYFFVRTRAN